MALRWPGTNRGRNFEGGGDEETHLGDLLVALTAPPVPACDDHYGVCEIED